MKSKKWSRSVMCARLIGITPQQHRYTHAYRPWLRVHIDYAGPFMNKMFLVLVDTSSKWLEVEIVDQVNSQVTIERLKRIFVTHSIPDIIVSDDGSAVFSPEFCMQRVKIKIANDTTEILT